MTTHKSPEWLTGILHLTSELTITTSFWNRRKAASYGDSWRYTHRNHWQIWQLCVGTQSRNSAWPTGPSHWLPASQRAGQSRTVLSAFACVCPCELGVWGNHVCLRRCVCRSFLSRAPPRPDAMQPPVVDWALNIKYRSASLSYCPPPPLFFFF